MIRSWLCIFNLQTVYMRNAFLMIALFFCFACQKKTDNSGNANTNPTPTTMGKVRVFLGVPDYPATNISYNNILFHTNISYPNASSYVNVANGSVPVSITNSAGGAVLYSFNASISTNQFYTLVVCDSAARVKASLINDVQLTIPAGNAAVRFLHISNLAGGANFLVAGASTNIAAARNFNDHQANPSVVSYSLLPSGTVNFEVRKPGVTGVAGSIATLNVDLLPGRYYTFMLINKPRTTTPGTGSLAVIEDL